MKNAKQLKQEIENALLDGIEPNPDQTVHEAVDELLREYTEAVIDEFRNKQNQMPGRWGVITILQCKEFLTKLFKEEHKG